MLTLTRSAHTAAGLGGLLWTVKALVITARDGSFEPLEGFVFVGGLLALTTAAVLYALCLSRRFRGLARVAATVGGALGLVAATLVAEAIGLLVIGGLASGDNIGLEQEGGILLAGVAWMTIAVARHRREAGSQVGRAAT